MRFAGISTLMARFRRHVGRGVDPSLVAMCRDLIDEAAYRRQVEDLSEGETAAIEHYLSIGESKGLRPNPWFDPAWYLEHNPDVRMAGYGALAHYIRHGWREGRNPGAHFDLESYRLANPDIGDGDPLAFHLARGRFEGRPLRSLRHNRPMPTRQGVTPLTSFGSDQTILAGMLADIAAFSATYGPVGAVYTLPLLGRGGGEKVAICFARRYRIAHPDRSVLFVTTDVDLIDPDVELPEGVLALGLPERAASLARAQSETLLLRLLATVRPSIFHIVNSELSWQLLFDCGELVSRLTKVYGSMFCVQRDYDTGDPIGFAASWYGRATLHCRALLSDNARFFEEARRFGETEADLPEEITVYNPTAWRSRSGRPIEGRAATIGGKRPAVLWAGRLDRQKRVDLLLAVAAAAPDVDFFVFGSAVTDGTPLPEASANLHYRGGFVAVEALFADRGYDLFMHTTFEEGMPNILLEIGETGLPILAPAIGGIPELVGDETGWLLAADADVSAYVAGIRAILAAPDEAVRRAAALRERVRERHSWNHFAETVADIPGYL